MYSNSTFHTLHVHVIDNYIAKTRYMEEKNIPLITVPVKHSVIRMAYFIMPETEPPITYSIQLLGFCRILGIYFR